MASLGALNGSRSGPAMHPSSFARDHVVAWR
jgi:hypothetical protein